MNTLNKILLSIVFTIIGYSIVNNFIKEMHIIQYILIEFLFFFITFIYIFIVTKAESCKEDF